MGGPKQQSDGLIVLGFIAMPAVNPRLSERIVHLPKFCPESLHGDPSIIFDTS
jgi:hypothetical protein